MGCRSLRRMDTDTIALHPRIRNWPCVLPVAAVYVPALYDLTVRDPLFLRLDELAVCVPDRPQKTARVLREAGLLFPTRTRRVWDFLAWCGVPAVGGD